MNATKTLPDRRRRVSREKREQKERLKKSRERRYGKSDEQAMNDLLIQAKLILYGV